MRPILVAGYSNPLGERLTEIPGTHEKRPAAALHHRQSKLGAGIAEFSHQRQWIELALHRRITGDGRPGREVNRKRPRHDCLGGSLALLRRQGIAARQSFGA